jgi:hypothetical protein
MAGIGRTKHAEGRWIFLNEATNQWQLLGEAQAAAPSVSR